MNDIFSIILGRWLLGTIGYSVRKLNNFFLNLFYANNKTGKNIAKSKAIVFDDYQNIIVGLIVMLIFIFAFMIARSL